MINANTPPRINERDVRNVSIKMLDMIENTKYHKKQNLLLEQEACGCSSLDGKINNSTRRLI